MLSFSGLIARLEREHGPDRRLDADLMVALLAPQGCSVDPIVALDGWDILYPSDPTEEPICWMESADVPHLTESVEDAIGLVKTLRPNDGAVVLALALRNVMAPSAGEALGNFTQRIARTVVTECIRAVALDDLEEVSGSSRTTRAA